MTQVSVWMLSIHLSTFSNIFSSETTGSIELKIHMEGPKGAGIWSWSHDQDGYHAHNGKNP